MVCSASRTFPNALSQMLCSTPRGSPACYMAVKPFPGGFSSLSFTPLDTTRRHQPSRHQLQGSCSAPWPSPSTHSQKQPHASSPKGQKIRFSFYFLELQWYNCSSISQLNSCIVKYKFKRTHWTPKQAKNNNKELRTRLLILPLKYMCVRCRQSSSTCFTYQVKITSDSQQNFQTEHRKRGGATALVKGLWAGDPASSTAGNEHLLNGFLQFLDQRGMPVLISSWRTGSWVLSSTQGNQ